MWSLLIVYVFEWFSGAGWIGPRGALGWTSALVYQSVLLAGAVAILVWQYSTRRTIIGWTALGCGLSLLFAAAAFFPPRIAFALQSRLSGRHFDSAAFALSFDAERRVRGSPVPRLGDSRQSVAIVLPVRVAAIPDGINPVVDEVSLGLGSWSSGWTASASDSTITERVSFLIQGSVDRNVFERLKAKPASLRASVRFVAFGNRRVRRIRALNGTSFRAPVLGRCWFDAGEFDVSCQAAYLEGPARTSVWFEDAKLDVREQLISKASYALFPDGPRFGLIDSYGLERTLQSDSARAADLAIVTDEPVAFVERSLEIPNIRLADYSPWE